MSETNKKDAVPFEKRWKDRFNAICYSVYVDLSDDETMQRVFAVPEDAVQYNEVTGLLDFAKHAYPLSFKTSAGFTEYQRAHEVRAAIQNGCGIYIAAPGSQNPRKLTLGPDLLPVLGEEVTPPANEAPKPPAKIGGWKKFANWITRGSAYKADFDQYKADMKKYTDDLAVHMEQVEEYAKAQAINGKSIGRNYKQENEYRHKIDVQRQTLALNNASQRRVENVTIIQNSYAYFFAPDMGNQGLTFSKHGDEPVQLDAMREAKYQVPKGMIARQAAAIAFAASFSEKAMTDIGYSGSTSKISDALATSRTMMVENYFAHHVERQNRQVYLDNAILNGRRMMPDLMNKFSEGDIQPVADVLREAITGLLENRRASDEIDGASLISYGTALENLKSCLDLPGMKQAVNLSDNDLKQMDAIIGMSRLGVQNTTNVFNTLVTDYQPNELEYRNDALANVIAYKMMTLDFRKERDEQNTALQQPFYEAEARHKQAIEEAVANEKKALTEMVSTGKISLEEANKRLRESVEPIKDTMVPFQRLMNDERDQQTRKRPLTPMEERAARDAGILMQEYIEKAKHSELYQQLSNETDSYEFRKKADGIVGNLYNRELFRESVSERELTGKQPAQVNMQRSVQPSMQTEMTSSKK